MRDNTRRQALVIFTIVMIVIGIPTVSAENITDTVVSANESLNPANESTYEDYGVAAQPAPDEHPIYRYFPELDPANRLDADGTGSPSVLKSSLLREGSA